MKILFTALALMIGFLSPAWGAVLGMGSNSLAAQKPTFIATNFATITEPSRQVTTLGFDARDRVIGKSCYNANGMLAAMVTFGADANGNLVLLTCPSGRTVNGQTTRWTVNPHGPGGLSQVLVETAPGGAKKFFVHGPTGLLYDVDSAAKPKVRHYHTDQVGSTVALTNQAGAVLGRAEYSAYGMVSYREGDTATPFLYNGAYGVMTDAESGLLNMRARYYHPWIGRFASPDPIGFSGGMNWYAYADGSPIIYIDPNGEFAWVVAGTAIGAVIDGGFTLATQMRAGNGVDWRVVGAATARGAVAGAVGSLAGPLSGTIVRGAAGGLVTGIASKGLSMAISGAGSAVGQVLNNAFTNQDLGSGVGTAAALGGGGQALSNLIPVKGVASLSQAKYFAPTSIATMVTTSNALKLTTSYIVSNAVGTLSTFFPSTSLPIYKGSRL